MLGELVKAVLERALERIQVAQVTPDVTGLASADPSADVIILDLELSGRMITHEISGLVAAGRRFFAFSAPTDPAIILAVLDAGAHAYVTKDEGRDCLVHGGLAPAGA